VNDATPFAWVLSSNFQNSTEIYDPMQDTWTAGPSITGAGSGLVGGAATLIDPPSNTQRRVLLTGGLAGTLIPSTTSKSWLFDPVTATLVQTAPMSTARAFHGQCTLPDGDALVIGGASLSINLFGQLVGVDLAACALFDASTDTWIPWAPLNQGRARPQVVTTGDEIVVVGGFGNLNITVSSFSGTPRTQAEIGLVVPGPWRLATPLASGSNGLTATSTEGGDRILVVGHDGTRAETLVP